LETNLKIIFNSFTNQNSFFFSFKSPEDSFIFNRIGTIQFNKQIFHLDSFQKLINYSIKHFFTFESFVFISNSILILYYFQQNNKFKVKIKSILHLTVSKETIFEED
jgi:hypothetical protein